MRFDLHLHTFGQDLIQPVEFVESVGVIEKTEVTGYCAEP